MDSAGNLEHGELRCFFGHLCFTR